MKRFRISIRWRSYRWTLNGISRSSAALLVGMLDHIPAGAVVAVVLLSGCSGQQWQGWQAQQLAMMRAEPARVAPMVCTQRLGSVIGSAQLDCR